MTQSSRERVMKAFRNTDLQLLVATDLAARGLDIEGITHIYNYDVPDDAENYIHRMGRTGRAGQSGASYIFATSRDKDAVDLIEQGIKMKLRKVRITIDEKSLKTDNARQTASKKPFESSRPKSKSYGSKPGFAKRPSRGTKPKSSSRGNGPRKKSR